MNSPMVAAILTVLIWSTNALAAKYALGGLTVTQLLTIQFFAATITLASLDAIKNRKLRLRSGWPPLMHIGIGLIGLTGTIVLQYIAFDIGDILKSNVIAYSWPLLVAIWAAFILRNLIGLAGIALAALGFYGIIMILDTHETLNILQNINLGAVIALASAMCMAFYTIASSHIMVTEKLLIPATFIGALSCLTLTLIQGTSWPDFDKWIIAVYIGIGPMGVGYLLWTYAMAEDGAKILAPIGFAIPLLSTLLLIVSGESYTNRSLYGIMLVLTCSVGVLVLQKIHNNRAKN